jgi:hypothetical protein
MSRRNRNSEHQVIIEEKSRERVEAIGKKKMKAEAARENNLIFHLVSNSFGRALRNWFLLQKNEESYSRDTSAKKWRVKMMKDGNSSKK